MANNLNSNPMVIDTFNADFMIGGGLPVTVKKVVLFSAADSDVFALKRVDDDLDDGGPEAIRINQNSNLQAEVNFDPPQIFPRGLYFDADAVNSGLGAGDIVHIYVK